jgi:hypothetical protein
LHGGHPCTAATPAQRPPLLGGHPCTAATFARRSFLARRPPMQGGHPCTAATPARRPPLHGGHPCTAVIPCTPATPARRPPLHGGHPCTVATSARRPPLHGGHPCIAASRLLPYARSIHLPFHCILTYAIISPTTMPGSYAKLTVITAFCGHLGVVCLLTCYAVLQLANIPRPTGGCLSQAVHGTITCRLTVATQVRGYLRLQYCTQAACHHHCHNAY